MRIGQELVRDQDVWITDVRCDGGTDRWSGPEPVSTFALILLRTGRFRRRADGVEAVLDPMVAYVQRPGSEQQVAHPAGGDTCTAIGLSSRMLGSLLDPDYPAQLLPLPVPPAADLAHRLMLRDIARGWDHGEIAERATDLAGRLLTEPSAERTATRPSATARRLADLAREALETDPSLRLGALAEEAGVSAHHLSRTFRWVTGLTIGRHRRRLMAHRALARLEEGETDLAALAAEVGFADQAHLTRTFRTELDLTPAQVRGMLSGPVRL